MHSITYKINYKKQKQSMAPTKQNKCCKIQILISPVTKGQESTSTMKLEVRKR